jgi:hypothetical protein
MTKQKELNQNSQRRTSPPYILMDNATDYYTM